MDIRKNVYARTIKKSHNIGISGSPQKEYLYNFCILIFFRSDLIIVWNIYRRLYNV